MIPAALRPVSIIIPARDHAERLRALLESLRQNLPAGLEAEIIVVDDGSIPPLGPLCGEYGAIHVRFQESRGPARCRNEGAARAQHPYLLLLDADVLYPAGALERAFEVAEANPDFGSVSFPNQTYDPSANTVANFVAAQEAFWYREFFESDPSLARVRGLATRCALVRRQAFLDTGGFDTDFKTNAIEDYDFGKRLSARFPCYAAGRPAFHHDFPRSLRRVLRNYFVRSRLWLPYYLKHRPKMDASQITPGEGALRVLPPAGTALALTGLPGSPFALFAGLVLIAIYALGLVPFLSLARSQGGRLFAFACFLLHFVCSFAIVAGLAAGAVDFAASVFRRGAA